MFLRLFSFLFLLAIVSSPATALRSTDIEAYLDPDYRDYQPRKILIVVNGSSAFRNQIFKKAYKRIQKKYGVEILQYRQVFVPTRTWTQEQIAQTLKNLNVDSILEITSEGYSSDYERVKTGSNSTAVGTASVYGNTVVASATTTTTARHQTRASDSAQISAKLTESSSGNTIWIANIFTRGSGTMMVGQGWTASSVMSNLVKHWKASKLLRK